MLADLGQKRKLARNGSVVIGEVGRVVTGEAMIGELRRTVIAVLEPDIKRFRAENEAQTVAASAKTPSPP